MPEHYPKSTVSAVVWCNRCMRETEHRIDRGRRGPCLVCLQGAETRAKVGQVREELRQKELFGEG